MSAPLLVTGDVAVFPTVFGAALVLAPMKAPITGSGKASVGGKPVCVAGDEASVIVATCAYTAGSYTLPGTAKLTIERLGAGQESAKVTANKAVLLATGTFTARLEVLVKAQMPGTPPQTDPLTSYSGEGGTFESSNTQANARQ